MMRWVALLLATVGAAFMATPAHAQGVSGWDAATDPGTGLPVCPASDGTVRPTRPPTTV